MIKLIITGLVLLSFTCNTTDENQPTDEQLASETIASAAKETKKLSSEEAEFLAFYQSFVAAVESKNAANVNAFIDEVFGVYFIESNGAMPNFKRVNDVAKFKSVRDELFFSLNFKDLNQAPLFEELPKIICDATPYNKQGCFAQKINPFANDEFWFVTDLNEKEKQAISAFAEKIEYTVKNTNNFSFYFTKSGNTWKIAFVDLRVPCEA